MSKPPFHVEIKILPILVKKQKERWQTLVRITVCDSIPDEVVSLYIEKTKNFFSSLVMLSILSDVALLSPPQIINANETEDETERQQLDDVTVATEAETSNAVSPYMKFIGSHRTFYASVDGYQVNGAMFNVFKQQLRSIAKFHPWIMVTD